MRTAHGRGAAPLAAGLPAAAFFPSTWAFTFSWAAVATAGVRWLSILHATGATAWEYMLLVLITAFIGLIAMRTVVTVAAQPAAEAPGADIGHRHRRVTVAVSA